MRILFTTAFWVLVSVPVYAADMYATAQPPMQLSEAPRYAVQPYFAPVQTYTTAPPVMAQPAPAAAIEAKTQTRTDIMWMNSF